MIITIISFGIIAVVMAAGFQVELEDLNFLRRRYNKARTIYPIGTIVLAIMSFFGNDLVLGGAITILMLISIIKSYFMARGQWKYEYKKYDAAISLILLCLISFYAVSHLISSLGTAF